MSIPLVRRQGRRYGRRAGGKTVQDPSNGLWSAGGLMPGSRPTTCRPHVRAVRRRRSVSFRVSRCVLDGVRGTLRVGLFGGAVGITIGQAKTLSDTESHARGSCPNPNPLVVCGRWIDWDHMRNGAVRCQRIRKRVRMGWDDAAQRRFLLPCRTVGLRSGHGPRLSGTGPRARFARDWPCGQRCRRRGLGRVPALARGALWGGLGSRSRRLRPPLESPTCICRGALTGEGGRTGILISALALVPTPMLRLMPVTSELATSTRHYLEVFPFIMFRVSGCVLDDHSTFCWRQEKKRSIIVLETLPSNR